jgi:hypothetical protein
VVLIRFLETRACKPETRTDAAEHSRGEALWPARLEEKDDPPVAVEQRLDCLEGALQ